MKSSNVSQFTIVTLYTLKLENPSETVSETAFLKNSADQKEKEEVAADVVIWERLAFKIRIQTSTKWPLSGAS